MEHAIANQASRIIKIKSAGEDKELLGTIEKEDLFLRFRLVICIYGRLGVQPGSYSF